MEMNTNRYTGPFLMIGLLIAICAAALWLWEAQFKREVLLDELASQSNYEGWQWLGHYQPMPLAPISHYEARKGVDLDRVFQQRLGELEDIRTEIQELEGLETPEAQLARDLLNHQLSLQEAGRPFVQYRFPLDPVEGIQLRFPLYLMTRHPIQTQPEAEAYMGRVEIFAKELMGLQDWMKRQEANDLLPPRFLIDQSLTQVRDILATPAKEHPLYLHLGRQLVRVDPVELNEWEATNYLIRLEKSLQEDLYPAWESLLATMEDWQARTSSSGAAYDMQEGERYYQQCLVANLGPDADPAIISQVAKQTVSRLRNQLDRTLDSLGIARGALADRLAQFERQQYGPNGLSPDSAMGQSRHTYEEFSRLLTGAFPLEAHKSTRILLESYPARWEQADFPAELIPAQLSGHAKDQYWINSQGWPGWYQPVLTALDVVPGTLLPRTRSYLPDFRAGMHFPAWEAGWSWYALSVLERDIPLLPQRTGMYVSYLHLKLLKAAVAQADVSVHTKKWDRFTAISYLRTQAGLPEPAATTEIDRIYAAPGSAPAALIGWHFFDQLYRDTYLNYPDQLSLKEWHQWLLEIGPLPFQMIEDQVNKRIELNLAG